MKDSGEPGAIRVFFRIIFLILFFFGFFPFPGLAFSDFLEKKEWKEALSFSVVFALDGKIQKIVQKNRSEGLNDLARIAEKLGNGEIVFPLVGIFYLAGTSTGDKRMMRASRKALRNMVVTGLVTGGLKWASGRSRPFEGRGPRSFRPFSGATSFPSGHAVLAFSLASAVAEEYPEGYKFFFFPAAVLVAYSRVYTNHHWASDTLASALIAGEISRYLSRKADIRFIVSPHALVVSRSW
ncbi:MAG: phosphatase PAP2 family protein [bacterium JZ-2024 1]